MRTLHLDISVPRFVITRLLGRLTPSAYFAPTSPLHMTNMPDPPLPGPGWVRVRNLMCGICGSDLHQIYIDAGLDVAPAVLPSHRRIYLGHEMVGVVMEAGEGVGNIKAGDRVVRWGRADDCLARGRPDLCRACRRGHRVLCEFASEPRKDHPVGGGFSDTFITPASTLLPVPDDLSNEQAIFTEPAAVAIHAVQRCIPKPGDRVLVLGCGTIGFLMIQALSAFQPGCEITAAAEFPWQAEMAKAYGAQHTFLAGDDGFEAAARLTGGKLYRGQTGSRMLLGGFDVVFDVVGNQVTLNQALRWTRARGTVVLVGVNLHRMALDLTPVWYQEVNLLGAVGHDVAKWEGEEISNFAHAMRWMQSGHLEVGGLLTHRFSLDEYREAFRAAVDKQNARSVKVAFDF